MFCIGINVELIVSAGVISTVVPDSPHKIFIGGLPNYLNEDQVSFSSSPKFSFIALPIAYSALTCTFFNLD